MINFGLIFLSVLNLGQYQDELAQIDQQITSLQQQQSKYRSSIERNTSNAMRWQFQSENYLDARKAWDKAAIEKQAIEELQNQIDSLEQKKLTILKENGKK